MADNRRFIHRGESGQWHHVLAPDDLQRYDTLVSELAGDSLVCRWLHTGGSVAG